MDSWMSIQMLHYYLYQPIYLSVSVTTFVMTQSFSERENRTQRMAHDQGSNAYRSQSRNLMFVKDPGLENSVNFLIEKAKRVSSLQQGRINIIHLLNTLPQTKHEEVRV